MRTFEEAQKLCMDCDRPAEFAIEVNCPCGKVETDLWCKPHAERAIRSGDYGSFAYAVLTIAHD